MMHYKSISHLALMLSFATLAGCVAPPALQPLALRVGTCNVRYDNKGDDKAGNGWNDRKADLMALIRKLDMDVFGMQEVHENQCRDLAAGLPEWEVVDDYDVTTAVAYRKSRFALDKKGVFWLSETPDVPRSMGWGAKNIRPCLWMILRDNSTGCRFCFANTHLDHRSKLARIEGMKLVLERMKTFSEGLPVVFVGDHNCGPDTEPAAEARKHMKDAREIAEVKDPGPIHTFHNWGKIKGEKGDEWRRCDYIYVSDGIRVKDFVTHDDKRPGLDRYPTDHYLLTANVELRPAHFAGRTGPWTKEKAWEWYNAQPWIRGCNYMPASAANRVDQWQELGSEERFAEVEKELALAETIGFNTLRILVEEQGFAVWLVDHDGFMARFERMLSIMERHGLRAIVVLGNDCSRPKEIWTMPKPGVQSYDIGYHGGRRRSQHGSFPGAVGYTVLDDPKLAPRFYAMCEELLTRYRSDRRILFWNLWNEPGNNNRSSLTVVNLRKLFELAWRIDPDQPLAADVWSKHPEGRSPAEKMAGELSDIISYHCYGNLQYQQKSLAALKARWGRPLVNTEWLARIKGDDVLTSYPFFAQNRVGCTCWGFVAGKYQTYEPYESAWKSQFEYRDPESPVTKWYHDLFRPSHHPYDPKEIDAIRRINAQMDAELKGESLRAKIAKSCKIVGEDMWYGYRRTKFDFKGRTAWVVEPSVTPLNGCPWTWTMQWAEAFVERTCVPDLLKRGFHHATIDLYPTRMDESGVAAAAEFQRFLVDTLGFAPKANLVGMSWGGFFSVRYTAAHPENVRCIYLDAPLLTFAGFDSAASAAGIGSWFETRPADGDWRKDPRMPVNMAEAVAKAGIPVLLLYGGQDQTVPPDENARRFADAFKAAGGKIDVRQRGGYGHHPHGVDAGEKGVIVGFFGKGL